MPSTKEIAAKKANAAGWCTACNWKTHELCKECADKDAKRKKEQALRDGSALVVGKRDRVATMPYGKDDGQEKVLAVPAPAPKKTKIMKSYMPAPHKEMKRPVPSNDYHGE